MVVSAIQTVASTYMASQIVRQAALSRLDNLATLQSQSVLPSTTVSLGTTSADQLVYNASGTLEMGSTSSSASVNQSIATQASVVTTDTAQNAANNQLAADLEASTIAENLAILDRALADHLAEQRLVNARTVTAGLAATAAADASQAGTAQSIETSRQFEIASQAIVTSSARTLDELLSANVKQSNIENVVKTSLETVANANSTPALPLPSPQPLPITNESSAVTSVTSATTTNLVAVSNTATNSLSATAEVASSPVINPVIDSAAQAVTTVTQNPAYANLVAGNYVSIAASAVQSPTVAVTPMRLEEIKPVIAIPAIAALSQLGAQSGRDGNPASGYRQRVAISNVRGRPLLAI